MVPTEELMDTTRGSSNDHLNLGHTKGATNPPLAASTWIGMSIPVFAS